ncbi:MULTISPECIES: ATP synthase F1 subunit epsilon [Anaerostipes]|uniref:ATP synthase F1 subunit epsilon n=1 Tax=Anaerostipes TaxID=207244 RepID=UPI000950EDB4|nr:MULTISPECIES: ATP synthase F1 subunit epsilon [Anaerostipes]MCI5622585.1 ATP synthase F1 subunit epsilon [Anaerostipes sp.]MDY2727045.1 ATP synthase F1 subunit epsilon [Anaerostipes faecalis]OLR59811.1 ATP synthase F1 subunit epsilon [Anaerostipes sp. 494a]
MADNLMKLEVTTPERTFYQGDVRMVELTTTEGDVGIYPKHIPMTMIVAPGVLTITESDGTKKEAALMKGFLEITGDSMSILAEVAEWPDEINLERARKAKERAKRRLAAKDANTDYVRAEMALKRALIREKISN